MTEVTTEDDLHGLVCALVHAKESLSKKRRQGGQLSPVETHLADLEEAAVAAIMRFRRAFELNGPKPRKEKKPWS